MIGRNVFKKFVSDLSHLESKKQFDSDIKEIELSYSDLQVLNKDYDGFKEGDCVNIYVAIFTYYSGNGCLFYMNGTDYLPDRDATIELNKERFLKNVYDYLKKYPYLKEV